MRARLKKTCKTNSLLNLKTLRTKLNQAIFFIFKKKKILYVPEPICNPEYMLVVRVASKMKKFKVNV